MKLTGFSYNVTTIGYGYIAPPGTVTFAAPTGTPVRGVVILCKSIVSATGSGYCYPKNVLAWAPGTYRYEVEYRSAVDFHDRREAPHSLNNHNTAHDNNISPSNHDDNLNDAAVARAFSVQCAFRPTITRGSFCGWDRLTHERGS